MPYAGIMLRTSHSMCPNRTRIMEADHILQPVPDLSGQALDPSCLLPKQQMCPVWLYSVAPCSFGLCEIKHRKTSIYVRARSLFSVHTLGKHGFLRRWAKSTRQEDCLRCHFNCWQRRISLFALLGRWIFPSCPVPFGFNTKGTLVVRNVFPLCIRFRSRRQHPRGQSKGGWLEVLSISTIWSFL